MKIEFIKPWRLHTVGSVVEVDPPIGQLLVQSGRAVVKVTEEKAQTITAPIAQAVQQFKKKHKR